MDIRIIANGMRNNDKLFDDLNKFDENLEKLLHKIGEDIVAEARNNIQQNTSINTGHLLSSIRILEEEPGKRITVGTDMPYAEYIEFGRGPVFAKDKPLHWLDKDTGDDRFAWSVKATEPQPFLEPAVIIHTKNFTGLFVEENENIIKRRTSGLLDTELL